jgi:hypothetical protein
MILLRHTRGIQATYGTLKFKEFECKTVELPWRNNESMISCIPEGVYDYEVLESSPSIKYPHVWIKDVPKRSGIKIHIANYVWQLRGCVAVGREFADIDRDGVIDVTESGATLKELIKLIPLQGQIEIK